MGALDRQAAMEVDARSLACLFRTKVFRVLFDAGNDQ
jgi:hypothetical protein